MVVAAWEAAPPRFLRRDAGAEVDRLYRRHADEVLRYAALVLRSRTDAEDIAQTVFLRALRAIERGEKVRTPRNWLIRITHNECRRLLASRKVHVELPEEIAVEPVEQGRAAELRVAMAALPAAQRQALVLRELEGRPYVEIARTLDLSVSAVETLIFRARRALREQIENALSCEEFVALLDDRSARTRLRAHARVCPGCATLDHRSRGRKSALKRIASAFGLPGWGTWWGAQLALTTATVATVAAVAVPHDRTRPNPERNLIPPSSHPNLVSRGGGSRFTSFAPVARPVAAAPAVADTAPVSDADAPAATVPPPGTVLPGPEPAPEPAPNPVPPAPEPTPLPSPAKIVPAAVPAAAPAQVVTVPQPVLPPAPEASGVAIPAVSLPVPAPEVPVVTVPAVAPNVSLP